MPLTRGRSVRLGELLHRDSFEAAPSGAASAYLARCSGVAALVAAMRLGWGTSQRPVAAQPVTRHDRLAVQTQTAPPPIPVPAANPPRSRSDQASSTGASSTARSVSE